MMIALFFTDTATTELYTYCPTLSLHDALPIISNAAADNAAYFAAVACAERRALHSYFDQHVIQDDELGYLAIDEGDYGALGQPMIDRIVYTARGGMPDEF